MKIYNVHYAINDEEHDYFIEAMNKSDALNSCWYDNAVGEDGEETYIALWCDELPDCEENRNLCRIIEKEGEDGEDTFIPLWFEELLDELP